MYAQPGQPDVDLPVSPADAPVPSVTHDDSILRYVSATFSNLIRALKKREEKQYAVWAVSTAKGTKKVYRTFWLHFLKGTSTTEQNQKTTGIHLHYSTFDNNVYANAVYIREKEEFRGKTKEEKMKQIPKNHCQTVLMCLYMKRILKIIHKRTLHGSVHQFNSSVRINSENQSIFIVIHIYFAQFYILSRLLHIRIAKGNMKLVNDIISEAQQSSCIYIFCYLNFCIITSLKKVTFVWQLHN